MIEKNNEILKSDQVQEGESVASVRKLMEDFLDRRRPGCVWIACSGGLDSMVLMRTLANLRGALPWLRLGVLHVNYGLRGGESVGDEAFVVNEAKVLGISHQVLRIDPVEHPKGGVGIQEWARERRYRWFRSILAQGDLLALAHHADDLVETIVMRLLRGSGLGQLQGMRELRGAYWRPFLSVTRAALEAEAHRQNLPHRIDSTNAKLIYTRNRLRLQILPELEALFPGLRQNILALAQDAKDFVDFSCEGLDRQAEALEIKGSKTLPAAVVRQRIGEFVQAKTSGLVLTRRQLSLLGDCLCEEASMVLDVSGDYRIAVKGGSLRLQTLTAPESARWQQYRKALLDTEPVFALGEGASIKAVTELEDWDGMVDNEGSDSIFDLPIDDWEPF